MKVEITDDDIEYAEKLLLPEGCRFNDERRTFIRCMESRDVVACPGSGKTRALLAKLVILAGKMPFAHGKGVCVLTHTNIAIDEIKERAGSASSLLFRYPNFFGTIQSFVNQFLAAPWYRSEFQRSIVAIENDRFFTELNTLYSRDRRLQPWLEPRGGLPTLGGYWFNPETLLVGKSLDEPIPKLGNTTDTFKRIQSIRRSVLEDGVLGYNDAYAIALRYCLRMPEVCQAVSNRFAMAFVDETQDTDQHQFRVLDAVFGPNKLVLQRIGDPNQAIYHDRVHKDGCWSVRDPLHFSDTCRYGHPISHLLCSVRLDDSVNLQACASTASHQPYIITCQEGEEQKVIHAFSRLIQDLQDSLPSGGTYKAVGWIGKDGTADGKLCIPAYFPQFDRSRALRSQQFTNLISYAAYAIQIGSVEGARRFLEIILQGIGRALNTAGIKDEVSGRHHTPTSAVRFWKREHENSYHQVREQIAACYRRSLNSGLSPATLRDSVRSAVEHVWPLRPGATAFLDGASIEPASQVGDGNAQTKNRFVSEDGVVIHIGTVHSVKGETHTATLFLETEYQKATDAQRLIEFLKGDCPAAQKAKAYHRQNLKIAHVAFSRPTHLLAFACRASSIAGHEQDLQTNGWVIRTVSELTTNQGGIP